MGWTCPPTALRTARQSRPRVRGNSEIDSGDVPSGSHVGPLGIALIRLDDLGSVQVGVRNYVADPEDEHHDGDIPKSMDGEATNAESDDDTQERHRGSRRKPT